MNDSKQQKAAIMEEDRTRIINDLQIRENL